MEDLDRPRLCRNVALAVLPWAPAAAAFYAWRGVYELAALNAAIGLAIGAVPALIARTGRARPGSTVLLLTGMTGLFAGAAMTGGLRSPLMMWCPLVPLVGGLLERGRGARLWGGLTAAAFAAFAGLTAAGLDFPQRLPESAWWPFFYLILVSVLGAAVAILMLYERSAAATIAALREKMRALEAAQEQITALEGLLPICMHCHAIRDEEDRWHRLEAYLAERVGARFSHALCQSCFDEHYPEEPSAP